MSFTTVVDKSAGDVFTEAMWDVYIKDNMNKGVMRAIGETVLGSATASITFSSIAADWSHLLLIVAARSDNAVVQTELGLRLNGDTGANYDKQLIRSNVAAITASEATAQTSMAAGVIPANNAVASAFGSSFIFIPNYAVAQLHAISCVYASHDTNATGGGRTGIDSGSWRTVAAITSLTLFALVGNLNTGTKATLYGLAN
jgi:hypothetical protein